MHLKGVSGKQWYAIAASSDAGKYAFTNPIWVNGPDVARCVKITGLHEVISYPEAPVVGKKIQLPPTAVLTTTPWTGFLLADWTVTPRSHNMVARKHTTYTYRLCFKAPPGYRFSPELSQPGKNGRKVSWDGSKLTYKVQFKAVPSAE